VDSVSAPRPAVFDTSIFVAQESRGLQPLTEWAAVISIITIAELSLGVAAATSAEVHEARAQTLAQARRAPIVGVVATEEYNVATAWVTLRRALTRKMPANDSWIAATALALGIPIITQDNDYDPASSIIEVVKI
jgi:predicted nucleic acid-binding protein